jgi:transposase
VWPLAVIKGKPVHKSHIEVLVRSKSVLVEEVIVYESPESFYLSVGLWSAYSRILVNDIQFLEHYFKAMKMSGFLVMRRKFQSIVREKFLNSDSFVLKPFVGSSHKICKCLGSFV